MNSKWLSSILFKPVPVPVPVLVPVNGTFKEDKPFKEDKQLKAAQRAVFSTPVFPISAMNTSATSEGKLICMPS